MGNQLVWNERYNIGVDIIDKEHKKLFSILNKLFDFGQQEEKSQWVCQEAIKYFRDHALKHFADEEAYMVSIDYAGLEVHRRIHRNFRERTIPALERELELNKYSPESVNHFLGVCAGWLIGHSLIEDHAIVSGENVKQWENLQPEEEQAVMSQTLAGLLHSMFQLEARLISNCYGGEKFGDGIYYRLIYRTRDKKRWEFYLIFEEQLIVSTIGSVMDTSSEAVSVMLMNASRYVAKQLVERMKEHFPNSEQFELKEEQLLTYDQFQKVFEKQSPQYSLLFDTGKGYFAYCATASEQLQTEGGVSIITENAMAEVGKYLSQNKVEKTEISHKKKVLVVDDSDFMLKAMSDLLREDYEVLTAKSGMSAIRGITLDRPDLILLDYEMPVCDGSQVLGMIRSEKEFADIPVIFLTSKVDKESVSKVIALKPEGYLSKSMPPETVKKEVDHFFEKKRRVKK
ncbi:MAG: response regulator [Lachnospiraceae bacterium]|jgi:hemerythrin-like metal-binding protein|nr:response regulator [Lachnospiraceae bacterium]MCI8974443.1 response regulator [Lachnospiraceae bacterium]